VDSVESGRLLAERLAAVYMDSARFHIGLTFMVIISYKGVKALHMSSSLTYPVARSVPSLECDMMGIMAVMIKFFVQR
jgi:hypothetical protein